LFNTFQGGKEMKDLNFFKLQEEDEEIPEEEPEEPEEPVEDTEESF